jgi:hypothetical protein
MGMPHVRRNSRMVSLKAVAHWAILVRSFDQRLFTHILSFPLLNLVPSLRSPSSPCVRTSALSEQVVPTSMMIGQTI